MTKGILISVAAGLLFGYFLAPQVMIDWSGTLLLITLGMLAFTVGIDLGTQKNLLNDIKREGLMILMLPFVIIIGTLVFGTLTAVFLPYSAGEMMAVSAGLGWYSMVPAMLTDYSGELGAVSFLHNVMRELTAIILIPIVAKRVGWLESISLPGAASMDVCLPLIERCTGPKIAVYSFVNGAVLTLVIPVMVTIIMEIFLI